MNALPEGAVLSDLMPHLSLELIYAIELSGVRSSPNEAVHQEMSLATKYHLGDQRLDFLFEAVVEAQDEEDVEVATFAVSTIATFSAEIDVSDIPLDLLEECGKEIALYAAYPYIRETIQDLSRRLALPNLTIPLLKRGAPPPFTQPK